MTDWLQSASPDFRELMKSLPAGMRTSNRLLRPVLEITREDTGFAVHLAGDTAGGRRVRAPGTAYNWVLDGDTIRPLPADVGEVIAGLIPSDGPSLSFPDVVSLLSLRDPPVRIVADESVYTPAKTEAQTLDGELMVPGLEAELFPYQARGVRWMHETISHTGGLILADEMGLGKTVQIISLLLLQPPSENAPALIICPTTLIANWRREIMRFAPEISLMIHRGSHRTGISAGLQRAQVVITTYDTLVNDLAIFQGVRWGWLICDEAQAIKNPDAQRRIAVASVPRDRTIPMTGTPVETSLRDLWSLTDVAIPGLLGDRQQFEARYPDDEDSANELAALTGPIVLRRRVQDVANDLPERIDVDVPLELGPDLEERYAAVLADCLQRYAMAGPLVAAGQLQIFCAHPWLVGGGSPDEDDEAALSRSAAVPLMTPKLQRTIELLEEAFLNGRKVLVFAVFNRCGDLIREAGRNLPPAFWGAINGSTPQDDRQRIVDEFTAYDGPACLVLNPKAAGSGLNITAATIVIHYTQAWNPALEAQASARAHRRGQTEPVTIYRLFYEGTVERVMVDRSEWRRDLANDAVPISTRDEADLRRVLTFTPERDNG
jgi:SNF2 family DNA or RNA helicase